MIQIVMKSLGIHCTIAITILTNDAKLHDVYEFALVLNVTMKWSDLHLHKW